MSPSGSEYTESPFRMAVPPVLSSTWVQVACRGWLRQQPSLASQTGEQILRRGGEAARRRPRRHRHHIGHEVPGRPRGRHPMAECECRSSTLSTIASSAHPKQPPRSDGHRVPPPAAPDESQVRAARVSPVGGSERPLQVPRVLSHSHSELGSRVQVPARQACWMCSRDKSRRGARLVLPGMSSSRWSRRRSKGSRITTPGLPLSLESKWLTLTTRSPWR